LTVEKVIDQLHIIQYIDIASEYKKLSKSKKGALYKRPLKEMAKKSF